MELKIAPIRTKDKDKEGHTRYRYTSLTKVVFYLTHLNKDKTQKWLLTIPDHSIEKRFITRNQCLAFASEYFKVK